MALRSILLDGEPGLLKTSRPIKDFDKRLHQLLDDMRETLINAGGAGLAAPQVGILRRAVLVLETNVEEDQIEQIIELINPELIYEDGEQEGVEGCLSFPGEVGIVKRPMNVKVRAQDRYGEFFEVSGTAMTARAYCHEIDHLNGIIYKSRATHMLSEEEIEEMYKPDDSISEDSSEDEVKGENS